MTRFVIVILFTAFLASCSSRVEYEQPQTQASSNTINVNTATADELEKLPGIGEKTAEAIVDHRERHGAFHRVEHLMLVPRVSESRFAELAPYLRVQ